MNNATILKVGSEELPIVEDLLSIDRSVGYKEFARILREKYGNLKIIVITLGADGAYCYDCKQDKAYSCESQKVEEASTVGAGDSFCAAFLTRYMKTKDINAALALATNISGFVVSCKDAIPQYELSDLDI